MPNPSRWTAYMDDATIRSLTREIEVLAERLRDLRMMRKRRATAIRAKLVWHSNPDYRAKRAKQIRAWKLRKQEVAACQM